MGAQKASQLAEALARCEAGRQGERSGGGHRLAADAAAKLLESGKLRQAEKAYLELVEKHGDMSALIGLARTQAALDDTEAALTTLREGAARFAKANDRATAVSLLAEAVALAPSDLSAHRRLAAALANQGDLPGAVEEYARFVDAALASHDSRRALLEIEYGRETLGDLPGLVALVDRVTGAPAQGRVDGPRPASRQAPLPHYAPASTAPTTTAQPAKAPRPPEPPAARRLELDATPSTSLAARTRGSSPDAKVVHDGARTLTRTEPDGGAAIDVLSRAGVIKRMQPQRPPVDIESQLAALMTTGTGIEAATVAASRAALLTGAHDPRASDAVLDAARRLLALGKLQSASDVLLDFIGHGFTDREAQRLLIEVDCALGRRDVAKEKCTLLSQAYRLDGRADVADDVERLARIL
ncbi:MAG TPA: hypothetical protein VFC31_08285 [Candidatus Limnocylindria bacterium]|nr:hypothetical protein [Candidatus Limnocylindria bacterium]